LKYSHVLRRRDIRTGIHTTEVEDIAEDVVARATDSEDDAMTLSIGSHTQGDRGDSLRP